jgi:hypothetical protein
MTNGYDHQERTLLKAAAWALALAGLIAWLLAAQRAHGGLVDVTALTPKGESNALHQVQRVADDAERLVNAAVVTLAEVREAAAVVKVELPRVSQSARDSLASLDTTQRILAKYAMHRADQSLPWLRVLGISLTAYLVGHTISEVWKWRQRKWRGKQ